MIDVTGGMKCLVMSTSIALAALLAGCGGGGGGGVVDAPTPAVPPPVEAPAPAPAPEPIATAEATGVDGIASDGEPIANALVTLTDSGGSLRTTSTDDRGAYRLDIKGLKPPFIVKVKRSDGSDWYAASNGAGMTGGIVPIDINGLTDKTLGYVADALNAGGGASSAVSVATLASDIALLDQARAKLRTSLSVPLVNAGFDPAVYDPATASVVQASADQHAAFLRDLRFGRSAAGRTTVIGTIAGTTRPVSPAAVAADRAGNLYVADDETGSIRKFSPSGAQTTLIDFTAFPGSAASVPFVRALALDAVGNLFVADGANYAIIKVSPAGVASTLAGGAGSGFADGIGTAAKFGFPHGMAVDPSGNVYVTDSNYAVRKITPAGVVTTIAGNTPQNPPRGIVLTSPQGIAADSAGNVYVGDTSQGSIAKIMPNGTVAELYRQSPGLFVSPVHLAVDAAGTVYAASYTKISRITAAGVASTLAGADSGSDFGAAADGNGSAAGFGDIAGLAIDADGNVLVADEMNEAVRKVTPGGDVSTALGKKAPAFVDGPAASASFSGRWVYARGNSTFIGIGGVAVNAAGDIYLADTGNHAVRRIARSGAVTTVAGNGGPGFASGTGRSASFNEPVGIALDAAGNIYVADRGNNAVRKISPAGDVSTLAGALDRPTDIAVATDGTVYVTDGTVSRWDGKSAIRRITAAGVVSTILANDALPPVPDLTPTLLGPIGVDASGTVLAKSYTPLYACDICFPGRGALGGILAISPAGVVSQRTNTQSPALATLNSLAVDRDGNAYELRSRTLVRVSPAGVTTDIATNGTPPLFDNEGHIAVDANGNIVVVDATSSAIRIVLP